LVILNSGGQNNSVNEETPVFPELAIARGKVNGVSTFIIRGHIPSFDNSDGFVDVSEIPGGNITYITSAQTLEIMASGNTETAAGDGLNTVLLQGVDADGSSIQETIVLNGSAGVNTINQYFRVNSILGLTAGSSGWNVSGVWASAGDSGIQARMDKEESISQNSHYTVPLGFTFYVTQLELNASQGAAGQAPEVEFKVYGRRGGVDASAAWVQFFDKKIDTGIQNELDVFIPFPTSNTQVTEKSDIRVRADTDQDNTEVRCRIYGYLIDNSVP
jgi:hypothetical protein